MINGLLLAASLRGMRFGAGAAGAAGSRQRRRSVGMSVVPLVFSTTCPKCGLLLLNISIQNCFKILVPLLLALV